MNGYHNYGLGLTQVHLEILGVFLELCIPVELQRKPSGCVKILSRDADLGQDYKCLYIHSTATAPMHLSQPKDMHRPPR